MLVSFFWRFLKTVAGSFLELVLDHLNCSLKNKSLNKFWIVLVTMLNMQIKADPTF